ncbi:type IV secretory system conjugative DNA transfer family protein [Photobacterium damselae]|uniref:type IV secretory system conjugative DNA transfer family protein n=1 Tax=Photobacterium damselae TaxID=38293 RepID=UPI001F5B7FDE|nr:type IV secretory system conjugative DNA transfer family protein [Photobacterium damselae]
MSNKMFFSILFIITTIIAFIGGLYVGGYYFLKQVKIDTNIVSYDTLFTYYEAYQNNKAIKKQLGIGFLVTAGVTLSPALFGLFILISGQKKEELHGSARFANDMELLKSGLLDLPTKSNKPKAPEILIGRVATGKHKDKLLKFRGQQFMGLAAPTRSGKGVGVVIPNLVNYPDTVITNDIKLENFLKSAGYRASCGQEIYLFAPDGFALDPKVDRENGNLRSHRWNPMSYIRRNPIFRVGDILNISSVFYPLTGDKNDIWNELAGKLFKGLTLYMLDNESRMPVSFSQLLKLTSPDGGLAAWMKDQIELGNVSEECKAEFNAFIHAPDDTRGSILSNLVSPLSIFDDAVCAAATSGDDFDLRDVRRKRMSIYVGIQPNNIKKFSKLINLFWSQLINENTAVLPENDPSLKYQCLMILDEFTSMGRVDIIQHGVGFTAGYNMRFLIIYQTDSQLYDPKSYGKDGAMVLKDNFAIESIYPPKRVDENVNRISETLGYKTVKTKTKSRTKGKSPSTTYGEKEDKRALMLPQEIVELGFEKVENSNMGLKQLLLIENMRPFIANKIIYYKDPAFMNRVQYSMDNVPTVPLLTLN